MYICRVEDRIGKFADAIMLPIASANDPNSVIYSWYQLQNGHQFQSDRFISIWLHVDLSCTQTDLKQMSLIVQIPQHFFLSFLAI